MKITSRTLNILKNFSSINNSILIDKGCNIETISREQNIVAQAKVEEKFPGQFAIYDLNVFLASISLFKDPDFDFGSKSVRIYTNSNAIEYVYCDPEMIPTLVDSVKANLKKLPDPTFSFGLKNEDLQALLKAGGTLSLPDFAVSGNGEVLRAIVTDSKNPSSHKFIIDLHEDVSKLKEFQYTFKFENLKVFPGNYTVDVCQREDDDSIVIGRFKHDSPLVYHIIVEDVI